MSRLLLVQLLGICLLLSQPSRAARPEAWWNQVVKLCDRQLVREIIHICGEVSWARPRRVRETIVASGLYSEIMPSSINKDTESLNRMEYTLNLPEQLKAIKSETQPSFLKAQQQYQPSVKDAHPGFEEFKNLVSNSQGEVEDNGPSALELSGLYTHSRKKRQSIYSLSQYCCHVGCTRKTIATYC